MKFLTKVLKANNNIRLFLSHTNFSLTHKHEQEHHQKHLGLILYSKLSFNEQINDEIHQANKYVGLLRTLQIPLPPSSFLTIYKSFNLDYAEVICDQSSNSSFFKKNQIQK